MSDPILSVRSLTVTFTGSGRPAPVLHGIDLDVRAGEVLGLVGESGSGKSVTSLAISGLLPPNAVIGGSIQMGDVEVTSAGPEQMRELRGNDIGLIFQDPTTTLNPLLPIGRQLTEGQVAHGRLTPAEARPRAVELLEEVDIANPAGRILQYPHEFSGGMRQRAVIAMAMAGRPRLIIADEPTTALDVTVQAQVLALLKRRQEETGAAVILITHDLGVVAEMADRVAVMYGGRIVETADVRTIFHRPRHPYTAALMASLPRGGARKRLQPIPGQPPVPSRLPSGCAFHPRCALGGAVPVCRRDTPALIAVEPDHWSACHFSEKVSPPEPVARVTVRDLPAPDAERPARREPLLSVENLKVHFPVRKGLLKRTVGHVRAVDGVSLAVAPGETLGLVGESGCGKTTTGRTIMGLVKATGGTVRFDGQDITHLQGRARRAVRRQMQYVFQDPFASLNPVRTIADIIAEPLRLQGLYEERGGARRIAELLDMVGLAASYKDRYPHEFSGGQKQRIGIARALALQPRLLILDEPVAALDVSIQAQIVNLLQDLQAELDLAYLFIAHDLSVVRHISDRVAVMYLGRIVEESDRDTLYDFPTHPYTQSLLSAVPEADPDRRETRSRIVLEGEIPDPAAPPPGCVFHPRCFKASDICRTHVPAFRRHERIPTHSACHHAGLLDAADDAARGELVS